MHTSKEYRQTAWSAIKPVLPIMLLIFLVASLPQLIFMFIQTAFGLMPPMDTDLLLSDPDAFVAAYSAFMSSSKGITYSLLNLLFTLMTIPLTLGTIGAAQRILRGEDVLVRHSLAYIPYTFRAIWLQICTAFYAFWPMLLAYVVAIPVLLTVSSPDIMLLTAILFFHRGDCDAGVRHYAHLLNGSLRLPAGTQPEHERLGDYAHQPHHHEGQPHEFLPAGIIFHRLESADCRA